MLVSLSVLQLDFHKAIRIAEIIYVMKSSAPGFAIGSCQRSSSAPANADIKHMRGLKGAIAATKIRWLFWFAFPLLQM